CMPAGEAGGRSWAFCRGGDRQYFRAYRRRKQGRDLSEMSGMHAADPEVIGGTGKRKDSGTGAVSEMSERKREKTARYPKEMRYPGDDEGDGRGFYERSVLLYQFLFYAGSDSVLFGSEGDAAETGGIGETHRDAGN